MPSVKIIKSAPLGIPIPSNLIISGNIEFQNVSSLTINNGVFISVKGSTMHTMVGTFYFRPIEFGITIKFKTSKAKLTRSWEHSLGPDEEPELKRLL